jgi:predicted lipoprotein with Yx(FWY)xxD motif
MSPTGNTTVPITPSSSSDQTAAATPETAPTTQTEIISSSSSLGNILTGTNGMTLYIFRADINSQSSCYESCASFWPPLLIEEGLEPTGVRISATLGTTERTDGTYQVTANGMPLYYYANDKAPGDVKGQGSTGSGARWYVISPSGQAITKAPSASSSSSGGY